MSEVEYYTLIRLDYPPEHLRWYWRPVAPFIGFTRLEKRRARIVNSLNRVRYP